MLVLGITLSLKIKTPFLKVNNYKCPYGALLTCVLGLPDLGCVPPYVPFLHIYPCGVGHDLRGDVPAYTDI